MIRIYFNRHEDAPQVWSVDEGSVETEICVQNISVLAVGATHYNPEAEYPEPKAWIQFHGATCEIHNGIAYIKEHRP